MKFPHALLGISRSAAVVAVVVVGLTLAWIPAAQAQINDASVQSDNIDKLESKQPVLEYALAGGFLLAAMAIGFKPSPRSASEKEKKARGE